MLCATFHQLFQLSHAGIPSVSPTDIVRIVCSRCNAIEVCPVIGEQEYNARNASASLVAVSNEVRDAKD